MNLIRRIAGAARLLATGKLAQSTSFDGAQMQRRLMTWRAGGESINSLILQGGELQQARARQLVRTNPYAANVSSSFTAHAVGAGIKPSSLVEVGALKDRIQRLWLAWTDEADADGLTDFYGLQAMAARAMFEAGECFFRFRPRRPEDGLSVPLQLQMLSSEHLPLGKCETLPNGNEIVFGIELDRIGRRVPYDHIHAMCGPDFFDDLITHPEVEKAYERWLDGAFLRQGQARGLFEYAGILFEEYRGRVGSVDFTDAAKAYFFPVGVPGLFRQYNAPADFVETANTIGLPRYAKQAVDQQFARWVMLHVQSNPLPICTRPRVLIKGKRT